MSDTFKPIKIDSSSGLSTEEATISDFLVQAWNAFANRSIGGGDLYPDDDIREFRDSIHACQRILMSHAFARLFKGYWK